MIASRRTDFGYRGMGMLTPADVPSLFRNSQYFDPSGQDAAQLAGATPPPAPSPQDYDPAAELAGMAQQGETFFRSYGGKSLAAPTAQPYDMRPPWVEPPAGFRAIFNPGVIATPAAAGNDQVVQTYVVPPNWDGVITRIANFYTGPGLTLGAGLLTWRILRNGQAVKNFDAITVGFGTYTGGQGLQPMQIDGIRIFANDIVQYIVNHAAGSGLPIAGTNIVTFLGGWIYPKGVS